MNNQTSNSQLANAFVEALGQMGSFLQVVEETARGFRTHMIREGWTEETAEEIAATFLGEMVVKITESTGHGE